MHVSTIVICTLALFTIVITAEVKAKELPQTILKEWRAFKIKYNKNYSLVEDPFRLHLYLHTKRVIRKHNKLYKEGKSTYEMGINQFADMLSSEVPMGYGFKGPK